MSHLTTSGGIAGNGAGNTQVLHNGARRTQPAARRPATGRQQRCRSSCLYSRSAPVTTDAVMFS